MLHVHHRPPTSDISRTDDRSDAAHRVPPVRVLIVDDEPLIRWSVSETLIEHGCSVAEAGDARSALAAVVAAAAAFDIILLDLRLPDSFDLSLLRRLHALAPSARIILMTAFGPADLGQRAREIGAFAVIGKPFEVDSLAAIVRAAAGFAV